MTTERPAATGRELLALLERAFARHAGKDARIDAAELQKALGLRSPYLARRVLDAFDRDGNGTIEREAIARHEWHPFTLSSAPERSRLTIHVRALGNWSYALRRLVEDAPDGPLTAYVDGPYGSPSAHIFASRVAVLIGAGIGVTPFASVLESLVLRANGASGHSSQLEKAYFFWLNRDQYSFEWFWALLSQLEGQDRRGLLEMHLCMTGARSGATALGVELARDVMHRSGRSDMITGLRMHTHVGRTDWEGMLGSIAERHGPGQVDAYYCGPAGLAARLSPLCRRLGMSFREERF